MELKTLEDLEINRAGDIHGDGDVIYLEDLKKEAIKDIKELRKNFENGSLNFSCDVQDNLEEYIKWKNNITEEDLK